MLGFIRHKAQSLISHKKSATFEGSTYWILIPSIGGIPSKVAPQQSLCPFIPTGKCIKNLVDTVYFTLPGKCIDNAGNSIDRRGNSIDNGGNSNDRRGNSIDIRNNVRCERVYVSYERVYVRRNGVKSFESFETE